MPNAQTCNITFDRLWENQTNSGKVVYALAGYDHEAGEKFRASFWPSDNKGQLLAEVQALAEGADITVSYTTRGQYKNLIGISSSGGGSSAGAPGGGGAGGGNKTTGHTPPKKAEFRTPAQMLKVSAMNISTEVTRDYLGGVAAGKKPKTVEEYVNLIVTVFQRVNTILQPKTGGPGTDNSKIPEKEGEGKRTPEQPQSPQAQGDDALQDEDIPF